MERAAEIEEVILGACLLENDEERELCLSRLRPEHFSLGSYRRIFRAICSLQMSGCPVNIVTLSHELATRNEIEAIGGVAALAGLTEGLPRRLGESHLGNYIDRVKEFWRLRELQALSEDLGIRASESDAISSTIVQRAAERMEAIVSDSEDEQAGVASHVVGFMDRFHTRRDLKENPGLSYGRAGPERYTDGMQPGEQTAVGAVSGVGKTTFMCLGIMATLLAGHAVDAFLLEPTKDQIVARLISLMTGVRYQSVIKPWKSRKDEVERIAACAGRLVEMPLRMFAHSGLTLDEVLGQARLGMRKYDTRLICVDYISGSRYGRPNGMSRFVYVLDALAPLLLISSKTHERTPWCSRRLLPGGSLVRTLCRPCSISGNLRRSRTTRTQ